MHLIDLHSHSTASDGSLSPRELAALGRQAGLKALALTDHDTIAGLEEFLAAGQELGLEVVPGVEISINGDELLGKPASLHVLGLWVDHRHQGLLEGLKTLQEARARRNPQIVQKFNDLGIPLTLEEVAAHAGGQLVGRPHFAQALLQRGIVRDRGEAFGRYLAAGAKAYVPKWRFSPAQGIGLLRAAGGLPVLAHPGMLKLAQFDLESLLRRLMDHGLEGLEALYSEHDTAIRQALTRLAARLGLVVSGGSDFHGRAKPEIRLGLGLGDLRVPATLLAALRQRREKLLPQPPVPGR
ncbi:MAG: PHP domain-containing protein [Desulfarculus sp.]|nr:PHP domain-containing protein [Desulfarculus sp.]